MHRVRTVLTNLVPLAPVIHNAVGPEKFASWLLRSSKAACSVTVSSTRHYNAPVQTEPFLNGSSSAYVEEMYNAWLADPKSVHVVSELILFILIYDVFKNKIPLSCIMV